MSKVAKMSGGKCQGLKKYQVLKKIHGLKKCNRLNKYEGLIKCHRMKYVRGKKCQRLNKC